jgi:FMN phosphatase YigB (HAD superfamily)
MAYSYKTGLMKPEQEAFHDLLKRLGQPDPETCLFVDNSKDNVLAAEKLGFQVHLFVDAVVLRHELEQLGLLRPKKQPPFVLRQHSPP